MYLSFCKFLIENYFYQPVSNRPYIKETAIENAKAASGLINSTEVSLSLGDIYDDVQNAVTENFALPVNTAEKSLPDTEEDKPVPEKEEPIKAFVNAVSSIPRKIPVKKSKPRVLDLKSEGKITRNIIKKDWYINTVGEKVSLETDNERSVYAVSLYSPDKLAETMKKAEEIRKRINKSEKCTFYLVDADSFEAAKPFSAPLVMNFANAHTPGGGFLLGAKGQEEALCRTSTLYASISNKKAKAMYTFNKEHYSPVENDYFLISPNVLVFRSADLQFLDKPYKVSVVTIAAPDRRDDAKAVKKDVLGSIMTLRLRKMLYVAADNGYRNLVLGAWGCGAFGNDPTDVAGYFKKLFFEENMSELFDNVVFAILGKGKNYNAFKEVLGEKIDKFD